MYISLRQILLQHQKYKNYFLFFILRFYKNKINLNKQFMINEGEDNISSLNNVKRKYRNDENSIL